MAARGVHGGDDLISVKKLIAWAYKLKFMKQHLYRDKPMLKYKISIGMVVKNEGPYLLEWLAWHKLMGVDHFFIADNGSTDGSSEMLREFDSQGLITLIDFPSEDGVAPQLPAYKKILSKADGITEWIAFIDADEFFNIKDNVNLKEFISCVPEDIGAIAVNWAIYGSSGRNLPGDGLVNERFTSRAEKSFGVNSHYKSILKMKSLTSEIFNPHHFELKDSFSYVNTKFEPLISHEKHGKGLSNTIVWENVRLNHYVVKSWCEFWVKKVARGRATTSLQRDANFFHGHNRNEEKDMIPSNVIEDLKDEMTFFKSLLTKLPEEIKNIDKSITNLSLPEGVSDYKP